MAPSALQAQQDPPAGQAGYGAGPLGIPKGLALAATSGSSGSSWPWIALVIAILAVLGAALFFMVRHRAEA